MKIAYIIYPEVIYANKSNGVRSQVVTWGNILRAYGHEVDFVNNWKDYNWKEYDAIHFVGQGVWIPRVLNQIRRLNDKCIFSPIYDPHPIWESKKQFLLKKVANLTNGKFHCMLWDETQAFKNFNRYSVRSKHEAEAIVRLFDVPREKIDLVPLGYSENIPINSTETYTKENFVLHISLLSQPRKNVIRLVKAANKYGFRLVLAGNKGTDEEFAPIRKEIGNNKNIQVLGFISEEEKINLYKRAKVFALPSIQEGVGIVALDAAVYGADIVITNIGGPQEYYCGMAEVVNPYDVDAIGKACVRLLEGETHQPKLRNLVLQEYSPKAICDKLISSYQKL